MLNKMYAVYRSYDERQTEPLHLLKGKDLDYYYYNVRPDIMYLKFD